MDELVYGWLEPVGWMDGWVVGTSSNRLDLFGTGWNRLEPADGWLELVETG